MLNAPTVLLCDAIEKLEQLASALAEAPDAVGAAGVAQADTLPPEGRLGKELLLSIRVLLPKLRTVRHLHGADSARRPPVQWAAQVPEEEDALLPPVLPHRGCPRCED